MTTKRFVSVLFFLVMALSLVLSACNRAPEPTQRPVSTATETMVPTSTATPTTTPTPVIIPQGTPIVGESDSFENAAYRHLNYYEEKLCSDSDTNPTVLGMKSTVNGVDVLEIWFEGEKSPSYFLLSNGERKELWAMGGEYGYKDFTRLAFSTDEIIERYPDVAFYLDPRTMTVDCHIVLHDRYLAALRKHIDSINEQNTCTVVWMLGWTKITGSESTQDGVNIKYIDQFINGNEDQQVYVAMSYKGETQYRILSYYSDNGRFFENTIVTKLPDHLTTIAFDDSGNIACDDSYDK